MSVCACMHMCYVWVWHMYEYDINRFSCVYTHREAKRRHYQTTILCPNSFETQARLVASKPLESSFPVPYSTYMGLRALCNGTVAIPDLWEVVTSRS